MVSWVFMAALAMTAKYRTYKERKSNPVNDRDVWLLGLPCQTHLPSMNIPSHRLASFSPPNTSMFLISIYSCCDVHGTYFAPKQGVVNVIVHTAEASVSNARYCSA